MAGAGLAWKLVGTGAAIGAGIAARKVLTTTWTVSTGKQPPANPVDPDVELWEAVAWAAVSGALIGLVRMLATRNSAKWWIHTTGNYPPKMQQASA